MQFSAPETQESPRPPEFRLFLQEELGRRCRKNPRFSLRAFARTLDVEASALSKIMSGKRSLTQKMLHRMCSQLGIEAEEQNRYEQTLTVPRPPQRLTERQPRRSSAANGHQHDVAATILKVNPANIDEAQRRLAAFKDEIHGLLQEGVDLMAAVPYRLTLSLVASGGSAHPVPGLPIISLPVSVSELVMPALERPDLHAP